MGWTILKVNRDPAEDRWCVWSSIVEAPIFWGPLAELERYWPGWGGTMGVVFEGHIQRATEKGSNTSWEGEWDNDPIYMQLGFLRRAELGALLDLYERVCPNVPSAEEVRPLLDPFDEEEGS